MTDLDLDTLLYVAVCLKRDPEFLGRDFVCFAVTCKLVFSAPPTCHIKMQITM